MRSIYRYALCSLAALTLAAIGTPASAMDIIVASDHTNTGPAIYFRDGAGRCLSRPAKAIPGGWQVDGTSGDDLIVLAIDETITVCGGRTLPVFLPPRTTLVIRGGEGNDIIWSGPGFRGQGSFEIYGDGGDDVLYNASGDPQYGGAGNDQILQSTSGKSYGGAGDDLFCAAVENVYHHYGHAQVYGGPGSDKYYGLIRPSSDSTSVTYYLTNPTQRDRCSLAYLQAYYSALALAARELE